ncbi:MAG: hypothetical protein DRP11_00450 [Candidatus Aenigmatarchaeota archaeon]|nr:MAG: hypothetical protein DRP11_00450 [Candidatus Aenigmarchaeota archaeon]
MWVKKLMETAKEANELRKALQEQRQQFKKVTWTDLFPKKAPERPAGHHDATARLLRQDTLLSSTGAGTAGLARDRPKRPGGER